MVEKHFMIKQLLGRSNYLLFWSQKVVYWLKVHLEESAVACGRLNFANFENRLRWSSLRDLVIQDKDVKNNSFRPALLWQHH